MVGFVRPTIAPPGLVVSYTHALPLYNIVPERGVPAQFAFMAWSETPTVLSVFPQSRADSYRLTIGAPNTPSVRASGFESIFCSNGVEGDGITPNPGGSLDIPKPLKCKPPIGPGQVPFLSNPVDCSASNPTYDLAIDSVEHAGSLLEPGVPDLSDPDWKTAGFPEFQMTGCDDPLLADQFKPTVTTKALQGGGPVQADAPSGLSVGLDFPQSNDPTDLTRTSNPSPPSPAAEGHHGEAPGGTQHQPLLRRRARHLLRPRLRSGGRPGPLRHDKPVTCPDSSKIGTAVTTSPLLASHDPITDAVNGPEPIPVTSTC